jgi:spermidine/putrescine transport system substrate-binding protein
MKRNVILILCLGLLLVGLPALAQDDHPEILTEWTCPPGFEGQTLSFYNWTTYIAEDDPETADVNEDTLRNFQELCGVTVQTDFFGSNEDLIARLQQGNPGYDIIVPTGTYIPQMNRQELLEPLDLSKIPNFANISEFLQDPVYDPGNVYSVPYQWGTIGVGYNIEAVGEEITSWEQVWNYGGNVAWLEDLRPMLGLGLRLLGYDANSTNPDEIAEAAFYLVDRGSNVRSIAVDDGQEKLLLGEADIVIEYSGDIYQIIAACESGESENCAGKYAFSIPQEGGVLWVDNLAIAKDAPNPELAHVFIDYILDAQVGADISNYTAYASPNQAAIDGGLILEEYLTDPIIYPDEATNAVLFGIIDVGDEAAQIYTDNWVQLKVLLGI